MPYNFRIDDVMMDGGTVIPQPPQPKPLQPCDDVLYSKEEAHPDARND